ncbi:MULTISPECIES: hypothetical protein [Bacillus]|nr:MULTISPECIES: hypothetical protein [Bacillus]APH35802.1 hypothetical protein BHE96_09490 [Bacillus subtilis]AMQ71227.1 hypothetical protein BAMY6639_00610 [Bacillus amyloliquefaciens UMAF6639]AMR50502.1 hypothetical protein A1R12_09045 [Bacillus amyloliquefaciens]ANB45749.1 hypothetical protein A1D33_000195 [Bacillus velezensis]ARJ75165.1 hypothetical protein B7941_11790 [Bacillus velezensis]
MLKSKFKKIAGATALVGALLVSGVQAADAATKPGNLIPIRNKQFDDKVEEYRWLGNDTVRIFFRDSEGKYYWEDFECVTTEGGVCYVYE